MEYEVRITLQAQAHLREIRDYIAQKLLAPEAAKSTVQRLGAVMASLSQMPKRVPLVEEEPWRSEGVRVILFPIRLTTFNQRVVQYTW